MSAVFFCPAVPDVSHTALLDRLDALDWFQLEQQLEHHGHACIERLLDADTCALLAGLYSNDGAFRSRVVMARHNFGQGEYKYFAYPLPTLLATLRHRLFPPLARISNRWQARLGLETRYPEALDAFLMRCHRAGQTRPTPLLLRYGPGDYNCMHQDIYGEHNFPLQAAVLLSEPGRDFTGGEFALTEHLAGAQRAEVVPLRQGDAVIFPVDLRPVPGKRSGFRRAAMRHGVSLVHSGQRRTLGLIFHDAT
ncbi:2OG-Fe(II) oxygenase [Pseudomonas leptonychotis]|jgi:hypothetical protein|uniref:2OG-Fe(II) oxygenase n=1 Tax=Pseudomonas leptonychotis TaxID=2448482 RepID=UPI0038692B51